MTIFTAPPNQNNLVLNSGDILNVNAGGLADHTTINTGGFEFVDRHGTSLHTTINSGGFEFVEPGGFSDHTTINNGGVENVEGISDNTTIIAAGSKMFGWMVRKTP
jgi:autotransporter passenger strand-loop-strand repeat protein